MAKNVEEALFDITPKIQELADLSEKNNAIDKELLQNTKSREDCVT